jgi:molybdopterin molybdotransferase
VIEFEDARTTVLGCAPALAPEPVSLADALGRVLAEPITATANVPPFDNSAMDGFAVRSQDAAAGARLRIVGESRAGTPAAVTVGPGEACAISTGAAMPLGADAVIRVEDTHTADGAVALVVGVTAGSDVRRAGADMAAGALVLEPGLRLGPAQLGVLASLGRARLLAGPRPRVGVVTTGDELVGVEDDLGPGEIRNSGAYVIPALVERAGGVTVSIGHARDDPGAVRTAIATALQADVAVITGGMSVGIHDHVSDALAELGVTTHFAGVALKPGKPFAFGTRGSTLVFGLPGNPVSSLITFLLFARPALLSLAGETPQRTRTTAILDEPCELVPTRVQAVRCRLALQADGWHATTTGPQSSHILTSLLDAAALAIIPKGEGDLPTGSRVTIELL